MPSRTAQLCIAKTNIEMADSSASEPSDPNNEASPPPVVYRSEDLLQGRRECWIEHGDQLYRLRVTQHGRLYLTK